MYEYWSNLSFTTRFSIIACVVTVPLGLLSMGLLGAVLYYPVSIFFPNYPSLNDWRGDWVWPATIIVGMGLSVGFLFGGLVWHYLSPYVSSTTVLSFVYGLILYLWTAFLWYMMLRKQF